jgi:ubiquinone/menaquinone biosynthesis C-methylase UbiE
MTKTSARGQQHGDADGYDFYMGGWSAALSPLFLAFVAIDKGADALDVGRGTGNLLAALADGLPADALTGVDPSATPLSKARRRPELAGVTLLEGTPGHLPFENGRFDYCLSQLVLQEFPDQLTALREMRRITQRGGTVAACQWDFARMPVINALLEAIT